MQVTILTLFLHLDVFFSFTPQSFAPHLFDSDGSMLRTAWVHDFVSSQRRKISVKIGSKVMRLWIITHQS